MLIALLLFLLQTIAPPSGQSPCPGEKPESSGPPTFVVQAVDPYWHPIAGAHITIRLELNGKVEKTEYADREGYARFWIDPDDLAGLHAVEADLPGFRRADLKHVPSSTSGQTAYVQLRLMLQPGRSVTVD